MLVPLCVGLKVKLVFEQIVCVKFGINGLGFTVIVKVTGEPTHPLVVGVTDIVAVITAMVVLVRVKELIELPVPLAAKPIEVLLFVHA